MIIKSFFTNSAGILISRLFGLVRDLMTASILGAGLWSDIFFIAFKLPNLFRRLFAEGAFTQAFLPSFVESNKKSLFTTEVFFKFIIYIAILTVIVIIFAPYFTKLLALGFDKNTIKLAIPYVQINFLYLITVFAVTFFASLLQYKGHFATTAFSTALLNISMIIALLLTKGQSQQIATFYLSISVVVGGILQLIVHIIALKYVGILKLITGGFQKYKNGKRANTKGFYKNFYHGVIGSSATQIGSFIDTWFASFLSFGGISYLYYANRIFQLPLALFAIALSTALFPKISKQIKSNNDALALSSLSSAFHVLLFLLLASTIGGVILSKEITWLIFERGAFVRANTIECAKVLEMFIYGLVPFGMSKLFSLWLYSKMQQKIASKITIQSLVLNVIMCLCLFKPMGASGLALASSISGLFLLIMNVKTFGFDNFLAIIKAKKIIFILLFCIIEAIILYLLKRLIDVYI